jgi:hypothetical protein
LCLLSLRERLLPEGGEPLLIITPTPVFFDRTLLRSFPLVRHPAAFVRCYLISPTVTAQNTADLRLTFS